MDARANSLVFLCYGAEPVFHECTMALLTLTQQEHWKNIPGFCICIYTDKPEWFSRFADCPLPLTFRQIDADTIGRWRGAIDFTHRVKIEALLDYTASHPGNVLYSDTDVVFRAAPDNIFSQIQNGNLYMHVMEGQVAAQGNPVLTKLNKYLDAYGAKNASGHPLSSSYMWNAGVLGFPPSAQGLLQRVLEFTDAHYPKFPKHIVEQFAFSVVFAAQANIHTAAPVITHYWNLKEIRPLLASFFQTFPKSSWTELQSLIQLVQVDVLTQEKSNFYVNRNIQDKIRGLKWSPAIPDWDILRKQL